MGRRMIAGLPSWDELDRWLRIACFAAGPGTGTPTSYATYAG